MNKCKYIVKLDQPLAKRYHVGKMSHESITLMRSFIRLSGYFVEQRREFQHFRGALTSYNIHKTVGGSSSSMSLTHPFLHKMFAISQTTWHYLMHFHWWKVLYFHLNFNDVCSWVFNWQFVNAIIYGGKFGFAVAKIWWVMGIVFWWAGFDVTCWNPINFLFLPYLYVAWDIGSIFLWFKSDSGGGNHDERS